MMRAALPVALLLLHVLGAATATSLSERWSRLLQGSWYYAPTYSPTSAPVLTRAAAVQAVPPCAPCPAGKYGMTIAAALGESRGSLLLHECRDCGMDSFSEVIGVTQCASCPDGWGTGGKTGSNSRFACVTAPDPTMAPNPLPTAQPQPVPPYSWPVPPPSPPMWYPTNPPLAYPTRFPTAFPVVSPTRNPATDSPTPWPFARPTWQPITDEPTAWPTPRPIELPTAEPTTAMPTTSARPTFTTQCGLGSYLSKSGGCTPCPLATYGRVCSQQDPYSAQDNDFRGICLLKFYEIDLTKLNTMGYYVENSKTWPNIQVGFAEHTCAPCPYNFMTTQTGATSEYQCTQPVCPLGQYIASGSGGSGNSASSLGMALTSEGVISISVLLPLVCVLSAIATACYYRSWRPRHQDNKQHNQGVDIELSHRQSQRLSQSQQYPIEYVQQGHHNPIQYDARHVSVSSHQHQHQHQSGRLSSSSPPQRLSQHFRESEQRRSLRTSLTQQNAPALHEHCAMGGGGGHGDLQQDSQWGNHLRRMSDDFRAKQHPLGGRL